MLAMSSNMPQRERRASSSSTMSAMSTASDHHVPGNDENDLSQSSQSSRVVDVQQNAAQDHAHLVTAKIEAVFEAMVDTLTQGGGALSIPYRNRNSPQRPIGSLNFPGRNVTEATKFSERAFCSLTR